MNERIRNIPGAPEGNEAAPGGRNPSMEDLQERARIAQGVDPLERAMELQADQDHRKERARGILGIKKGVEVGPQAKAKQMAVLKANALRARAKAAATAAAPEVPPQAAKEEQKTPPTVGERITKFFKTWFE